MYIISIFVNSVSIKFNFRYISRQIINIFIFFVFTICIYIIWYLCIRHFVLITIQYILFAQLRIYLITYLFILVRRRYHNIITIIQGVCCYGFIFVRHICFLRFLICHLASLILFKCIRYIFICYVSIYILTIFYFLHKSIIPCYGDVVVWIYIIITYFLFTRTIYKFKYSPFIVIFCNIWTLCIITIIYFRFFCIWISIFINRFCSHRSYFLTISIWSNLF